MDKQTFVSTLVENAGRSQESAEKSWSFLAEKCGWEPENLAHYVATEVRVAAGDFDNEYAETAAFEWRARIDRNGGH